MPAHSKRSLTSPLTAGILTVFGLAFLVQVAACVYLARFSQHDLKEENQRLTMEIARDLSSQIGRALAGQDDLAALAALNTGRSLHPRLLEAMVYDKAGKVLMHTDPGMLGKSLPVAPGPHVMHAERFSVLRDGRPVSRILIPASEGEWFFQAFFDDSRQQQGRRAAAVRVLLLAALASLLPAAALWLIFRRFAWVDLRQPALDTPEPASHSVPELAVLLLEEMPHAALAVNRENRIVGANTLALELLNCRREELEGLHIHQAPLASTLVELYQQAIRQPGRPLSARVSLSRQGAALDVRIVATPPSPSWQLALVTLS